MLATHLESFAKIVEIKKRKKVIGGKTLRDRKEDGQINKWPRKSRLQLQKNSLIFHYKQCSKPIWKVQSNFFKLSKKKSISDVISMLATHLESFAKIVKIKKRKKVIGGKTLRDRKEDGQINKWPRKSRLQLQKNSLIFHHKQCFNIYIWRVHVCTTMHWFTFACKGADKLMRY